MVGPAGFLESRTSTDFAEKATSTQLDVLVLLLLLRQPSVLFSGNRMSPQIGPIGRTVPFGVAVRVAPDRRPAVAAAIYGYRFVGGRCYCSGGSRVDVALRSTPFRRGIVGPTVQGSTWRHVFSSSPPIARSAELFHSD
jgi:hypothetical protein